MVSKLLNSETKDMLRGISLIGLLLGLGLIGCGRQSTPNAEGPYGVFKHAGIHEVTEREYRVDPPDTILIKAPDIKEVDGVEQVVRPDGKVSLELVGEVSVNGLTPIEISEELKRRYSKFYVKPEIRVQVVANSKFYYVFGNGAEKRGKFPYTGRVTLITAIADAGYSADGWPEQVRLSRPGRNGAPNATAVIDFTKVAGYGDLSQNYLIEEGDVLDIPFNPISKFSFDVTRIITPFTGSVSLVTSAQTARTQFDTNNSR
jgi:polysaccharide biosynthesis/export protein